MRLFSLFAAAALLPAVALAGGDHENHMQEVDPIEEGDLSVHFSDQHCQNEFAMVKAEFRNDSSDYLVVRKEAAVFEIAGDEMQPYDGKKKKPLIVKPRSSKKHTYKVKADDGLHVEGWTLQLTGIYTASESGDPLSAPEFQLPASVNTFDAGPYDCKLGLKQETKETVAQFSCKYNGDSIGFIDPAEMGIKIEGGQEFANVDRKASKKMLLPGDSHKFKGVWKIEYKTTDMQFAVMHIQWRDTFSESALEELDLGEVEFELDEEKTAEKND